MILSVFFYIFVFLIVVLLARRAVRLERLTTVLIIILILSLVSGLRAYTVGIDTVSYRDIFEAILNNDPTLAWRNIERGFLLISRLLLYINDHTNFLLFSFAVLTHSLIILRLWDFRKMASFPWSVAWYYVSFYFMSMNVLRQYCAVAIIFFATRYLQKKNYIKFVICVGIAFLFHRSALIGLLFMGIEVINWKELDKKQKIFIMLGLATVPAYLGYILPNLQRYLKYFQAIGFDIGFMLPLKIVMFFLLGFGLAGIVRKNSSNEIESLFYINRVKIYYLVGLVLTFFGYFFSFMDRIGLVFYLFECVFIGIVVKNRKDRVVCQVLFFLLIVYSFYSEFSRNGQGILPYLFFWNL